MQKPIFSSITQHDLEIQENLKFLESKPLIAEIYASFHRIMKDHLSPVEGAIVEIGSGLGLIKRTIPDCICTDLFENSGIDRVENAYCLSDGSSSIANLILMDVFHHLRYPGTALREWHRVLALGGRVILLEPDLSLMGRLVYGCFHHEPLGVKDSISWTAPSNWSAEDSDYYAAQGNAHRIFLRKEIAMGSDCWKISHIKRYSSFSYIASGGFSKPQLYPTCFFPLLAKLDFVLDCFPSFFSTRLLVVLEKCN